jgi:hypothetical protein
MDFFVQGGREMQVPVYWKEEHRGSMTVEPAGEDLCFTVSCRGLPKGLYRLIAHGDRELLLGNVESDGREMHMARRFSPLLTKPLGQLQRAEIVDMDAQHWQSVDKDRYPDWPKETLMRRETGGVCLAVPYDPHQPFAMPQYFCFAHVIRIGERQYAAFRFDSAGLPR